MKKSTYTERSAKSSIELPLDILLYHRDAGLSSTELVVYLFLMNHTTNGICNPSMSSMAKWMGVTRFTIKHHLSEMKAKKLISISGRTKPSGAFAPNEYDLSPLVERCEELSKKPASISLKKNRQKAA